MNQEHHNKELLGNGAGINQDINGEISTGQNSGKYFDAQNMRLSDAEGDKGVLKKIKGETIFYQKSNLPGTYVCIGTVSVNDKLVEFFVEQSGAQDPVIRIDGVVSAKSDRLPFLVDFPLQIDKNENCLGGEIFVTDYNSPPLIFNVQDMIDNQATQKYFTEYNNALYTVNLDAPLDVPVFVELVNVGGGGGLPVGSYQYSLRYSNDSGDRTNWGPLTPPIPVVRNLNYASDQYPGSKTFGDDPDVLTPTSFAPKIRFRVTNLGDYEFIEVRRISYNIGGGVDIVPSGEIVAKIPVGEQEISVREFLDPTDSNVEIVLADNEETNIIGFIEKAKAIRYHDKRLVLMNISTPDKEQAPTFKEINGKKIFPVVDKIGKNGHNEPWNHTYRKNYMSGEKHTFGVCFFDSTGGKGFVATDPALENVQAPNRRNPADADSQLYSYKGMVKATQTDGITVGSTFEIFDLENAVQKTDTCSFKNILNAGSKGVLAGVDRYCPPTLIDPMPGATIGHVPLTPVSQNDQDVDGHNYQINKKVGVNSGTKVDYNPQGFAPDYYTRGFALGGVENIPGWAKAFSVVKTERADRVICQGIGMYKLNKGQLPSTSLATKDTDKLWFHSADIEQGLISQETLDNINANPSEYKIQLISPLGFFSELYSFNERELGVDSLCDLITYARVLHDEGQINNEEIVTMGISDGLGGRYVSYNRYRNDNPAGGGAFFGNGDILLGLNSLTLQTNNRGANYFQIQTTGNIYNTANTGGIGNNDFDNVVMQQFTEPFYIVNIIQTGKEVRDLNIDTYRQTGTYQKVESIIGVGDSTPLQQFLLVDERWEDCIPALSGSSSFASDEVFVYLEDPTGGRKAYMNVTFLSAPAIALINADITSNGFWVSGNGTNVYGLYTHINTLNREFTLVFDQGYDPTEDDKIIVRYDTRLPINFYGGDTTISENIFSPIDQEVDEASESNQFDFSIGFPYRRYELNPRYYQVVRTTGVNRIQDTNTGSLGYLRQMCIMYASENRVGAEYAYGLTYPFQHFPQTNYVMRPMRWNDGEFGTNDPVLIGNDNNLFPQYFIDYPQEWLNWKFGGFRYQQKINTDYAVKGAKEFFSRPDVGFTDQNDFCTRVWWSLPRQINVQDSPSLKSFPVSNIFDIDDKNGRIVFAWDTQTGQTGENLYAVTHNGICLLLTKKSILSNLSGDDLAIMATDSFINSEYWITNEAGSPAELWRGIAEANMEMNGEQGTIRKSALFFFNKENVFRLMDNVILDISANSYRKTLRPVLGALTNDYTNKISSVFNELNNEYWFQIGSQEFVYDQSFGSFVGRFTYDFDKYTFHKNRVYGSRDLTTFILESGFQIGGEPIEAFLLTRTSAPMQPMEKEFISVNINTGLRGTMKPTEVVFIEEQTMNELCRLNQLNNGPLYLKQYDGWFQFIPRKDNRWSPSRERIQGRLIFIKIIHNFEEEFKITNTVVQSKIIK